MAFLVYENENGAICFWPGSDVGVGRVSVSPSVQGMHGPSSSNCGHFHLRMTNFGLVDQLRNWLVQFSCANHKDLHVKF